MREKIRQGEELCGTGLWEAEVGAGLPWWDKDLLRGMFHTQFKFVSGADMSNAFQGPKLLVKPMAET